MNGDVEQLPLEIVQRSVDCRFRRLLPGNTGEPLTDLLECERVVSDELGVLLDEPGGGPDGLAVAVDRGGFSVSGRVPVMNRNLNDIGMVGRFSGDDERFREVQADDSGLDLHAGSLRLADCHDVRDGVGLFRA